MCSSSLLLKSETQLKSKKKVLEYLMKLKDRNILVKTHKLIGPHSWIFFSKGLPWILTLAKTIKQHKIPENIHSHTHILVHSYTHSHIRSQQLTSTCKEHIIGNMTLHKNIVKVRKSSCRKRNTKHTPTSQAKHTHTHTDTHMPPIMHQLVKNTRKTYIK